ncbi:MAG: hypothetical protein ACI82I_001306 [Gammaproteobacteria bacterium]|jgi:hypothetical protein
MTKTTVIDFAKPSDFSPNPLTDVLRQGACGGFRVHRVARQSSGR